MSHSHWDSDAPLQDQWSSLKEFIPVRVGWGQCHVVREGGFEPQLGAPTICPTLRGPYRASDKVSGWGK
ncbi:hypothetical protein B296_00010404 [Ensete ventricosum]|uniref:Uncharacterized protein n=1 Tax=Ensete ventricosum TaxID=4639 RepID=A0A427A9L9_ENSVE|nr:hypothetical protein B296_00010404 [Ensete ventricosum]